VDPAKRLARDQASYCKLRREVQKTASLTLLQSCSCVGSHRCVRRSRLYAAEPTTPASPSRSLMTGARLATPGECGAKQLLSYTPCPKMTTACCSLHICYDIKEHNVFNHSRHFINSESCQMPLFILFMMKSYKSTQKNTKKNLKKTKQMNKELDYDTHNDSIIRSMSAAPKIESSA